jgi:hypothetical protein
MGGHWEEGWEDTGKSGAWTHSVPARSWDYPAAYREGFADTFTQLVAHVHGAVAAGEAPSPAGAAYPTFHSGVAALCVQAAALTSGRSGRWEEVVYAGA